MKKTKTVKWICPRCKKEWISRIEEKWFGYCYNCGQCCSFIKETKKKAKWKYIKDELYDNARES